MKTIETVAKISPTGEIHLSPLANLPTGIFKVILVIDETAIVEDTTENLADDSFLAAAGDLIGCLEDLPPDLSHNKRYLESLGD